MRQGFEVRAGAGVVHLVAALTRWQGSDVRIPLPAVRLPDGDYHVTIEQEGKQLLLRISPVGSSTVRELLVDVTDQADEAARAAVRGPAT